MSSAREEADWLQTHPEHVSEMMSVPNLTQQQVAYRLKKCRNQKQQEPHVQSAASLNFNEEHHSNLLNSNNFSTNFNESTQEAYIQILL
ncbi:hypothetical protein BC332_28511 [Capsicum chinense]|nr:hypothetical protein BC332_28511 [Capsicum chinense]